jgi:hypothetical protein
MSSLQLLLKQQFFPKSEQFVLIRRSDHETSGSGRLIIQINGHTFYVCQLLNSLSSVYEIAITSIGTRFETGRVYCVRFGSMSKQIDGLICFHDIPKQMPIEGNCPPIGPPIHFSVSLFDSDVFKICFGTPYETTTPNFGIGFLKVKEIMKMFMKKYELEYNIHKLWFIFMKFLWNIGYFKIFDYDNFRVFSFMLFTQLVPLGGNIKICRRNFYSFIECLLMNNCQFLIHGQSFRPVRGTISPGLIELFSGRNPPIVNFIDEERGCVGLTIYNRPDYTSTCVRVSLSTTKVCSVGPIYELNNIGDVCIIQRIIDELKQLLPISSHDDDDDNYFNGPMELRRRPAGGPNTSSVENGRFVLHGRIFLLFKSNISGCIVITCFIESRDGTFESFPYYFLTLLFAFAPDNRFLELDDNFDGSIDELGNALIRSGFEKIFNGTASPTELHTFLFRSHFGIILQILIREYEAHDCVICDAIQETTHFKNFKSVLEIIIRLCRERKNQQLSEKICDLFQFLDLFI